MKRTDGVEQPGASAAAPRGNGEITARCTVSPECPARAEHGQLTTSRSAHTWAIENGTDKPCNYVVALEIFDDLGHAKIKEVPGELKPHSRLEDSTSISLMTTYGQGQKVQLQARTTIRAQDRQITESTESCSFDVE